MMSTLLTTKKMPANSSQTALRKPRAYQKRGVVWLVSHGGAAVFCTPGMGKTSIVLRAILALKESGVLKRALVIAPLRVAHEVWPEEPKEWAGSEWDKLKTLKIVVLHGPHKEYLINETADIFVINPDGLKWLFESGQYKQFRKAQIDTLIVDESTMFSYSHTKRFKMLRPVLPSFSRRWILTGSPTPNGYLGLFGQIFCVDFGRALGRYVTHYRNNYFYSSGYGGYTWLLQAGAEERIQKAITPYVFRLDAKDYMELPAIVENVIRVELPKAAMKVYKDLEDELITELEDKVVTAASTGAAHIKCSQVANGGLYFMPQDNDQRTGRRTWKDIHSVKVEAVEELVAELQGSPAMVVYEFEHDLARLQKAFPDAPHIGGGVGDVKQILKDWNEDKLPVLLVHPAAVSHGLNMQYGSAATIIWHSLTYNYEHAEQLVQRLARQGSKQKNIFVHYIVARNTIDEVKLRALRKKEKTQTSFLNALKEYAKGKRR
jgi:SNF2 family DNA or RNA helicase